MEQYLTLHKQNNPNQPFFLYMAYQQAHTPLEVHDYYKGKLLEKCKGCSSMEENRQVHLGTETRETLHI